MTATLSGAGILSFGGGTDRYIPNSAITLTDAANLTLNGDAVDNVTDFPLGRGDGVTNTLALHPSITTLTTLYRTDWQGTVVLSQSARTNICPYSEPQIANLNTVVGTPAPANTTLIVPGYKTVNAIYFASPTDSQAAYKTITVTAGLVYSMMAIIKMDDGSKPIVGSSNNTYDLSFVIAGNLANGTFVYKDLGSGVWLVELQGYTATSSGNKNSGIAKYITQSSKAFTVSCFHIEQASSCGSYIPTTSAPVTVTDYSVSGSTVTFAETPVYNAEFSLDGAVTGLPFLWAKP